MKRLLLALMASAALTVGLMPAASSVASGTTFYVDPASIGGACSDTHTVAQAQVISTPWCSLPQAIKMATDGSTVDVRASNIPAFTDHWPLGYPHLQNRSAYVTFEPYGYGGSNPEQVTLNGMNLVGVDHETWQGFTMIGSDNTSVIKAVNLQGCAFNMSFLNNDISGQGIGIDGRCSFTPPGPGSTNNYSPNDGHDLIQGNNIHNTNVNPALCSNQVLDGMGVQFSGTDDVRVLNNNIDTMMDAINFGYATNVIVRGNTVKTIFQSQMPAPCTYHVDLVQTEEHKFGPVTIDSNNFRQGGQFIIRNETGLTFSNNLVQNVQGWLQSVSNPGAQFINNTFEDHGQHVVTGAADLIVESCNPANTACATLFTDGYFTDITGTVVKNNIFGKGWGVNNTPTSGACCVTSSQYSEDYNIVGGVPQNSTRNNPGTHDLFGTPIFVTAPANQSAPNDYILTASSIGYSAGDGSVAPPTDLVGTPRPSNPDIGAMQHLGIPANTTPPTISSQLNVVSVNQGSWTNSPTSYAYQWKDCDASGANCANIAGATGTSYTLRGSDVGNTIVVTETATAPGGSASADSGATRPIIAEVGP